MKRISLAVLGLAVAIYAVPALAQHEHAAKESKEAKEMKEVNASITGEVVDMGCYMGKGARGEKHIGCATKCIDGGMPMGLLTAKGALYLLTLDHENADPYNSLKTMAGKTVTVTGPNTFTYNRPVDPGSYVSGGDIQPLSTIYLGFTNARGTTSSVEDQFVTIDQLLLRSQ